MHFLLGCLLARCIRHHVNCDIGCTEERTAKGPSAKRSRSVVVKAKTRAALAYTRVVRSRSVCGCNWPRAKCLVVQCKSRIWTSFMSPFLPSFLPSSKEGAFNMFRKFHRPSSPVTARRPCTLARSRRCCLQLQTASHFFYTIAEEGHFKRLPRTQSWQMRRLARGDEIGFARSAESLIGFSPGCVILLRNHVTKLESF